MVKPISRKVSNTLMIVESLVNLASLPLGLVSFGMALMMLPVLSEIPADQMTEETAAAIKQLKEYFNPTAAIVYLGLFFLTLSAARMIRGFRLRATKGENFFRLAIGQAAAFLACALLPVVIGYTQTSTMIVSIISAAALFAGRVVAVVKNHRIRSIIPNVLAAAVIVYCAQDLAFMCAFLFLLSVFALLSIVFSRISFSVLKKIVVKTHASEIIFGLVLLIVTFALLLTFFEPNMGNFKDALWYCFAIVTTIGFGDLTAVTDFGRILSVILGAYGIVVVALITSIIVNFYSETKTSPDADDEEDAESEEARKPEGSAEA